MLSAQDIADFNNYGYIYLNNVFTKEIAKECRDIIWDHLGKTGIMMDDPQTWPRRQSIGEIFSAAEGPWCQVINGQLVNVIDEVLGVGRWESFGCGWWTISFPGTHTGWDDDCWGRDGSWHIDGSGYTRYLCSKEVGAVPLMLFSDIKQNQGGTLLACGSHKLIIDALHSADAYGLSNHEIKAIIEENINQFEIQEITGDAGDIVLMHPFLVHARSKNMGLYGDLAAIRVLCHPVIPLKETMNLNSDELTYLENSIVENLKLNATAAPRKFVCIDKINDLKNALKSASSLKRKIEAVDES
jgi:hypothetical protein